MRLPEYRKREIQGRLNGLCNIASDVHYGEIEQFIAQLEPDSREYQKYIYLARELRRMKARFEAHLEKPKVLAIRAIESEDTPATAPEPTVERVGVPNGRGKT